MAGDHAGRCDAVYLPGWGLPAYVAHIGRARQRDGGMIQRHKKIVQRTFAAISSLVNGLGYILIELGGIAGQACGFIGIL